MGSGISSPVKDVKAHIQQIKEAEKSGWIAPSNVDCVGALVGCQLVGLCWELLHARTTGLSQDFVMNN